MLGFWIIVSHLIGDYVLQSDWMAQEKTKRGLVALSHAAVYTVPFALIIAPSWQALVFICCTHFWIDRFRLARYVCWAKNFLSPPGDPHNCQTCNNSGWRPNAQGRGYDDVCSECGGQSHSVTEPRWWHPWHECSATGYHKKDRPPWLAVWLMIITDNTLHLLCNGIALTFWP